MHLALHVLITRGVLHPMSFNARHAAAQAPTRVTAQVTLHDCLACSGCITSAETVLLQHQSTDEFLSKLRDPSITVVVSIAPQSRAALAGQQHT